jgi:hypothetical protein
MDFILFLRGFAKPKLKNKNIRLWILVVDGCYELDYPFISINNFFAYN